MRIFSYLWVLVICFHQYRSPVHFLHCRDLGQLIGVYADGIQEVFEQSHDLTLAQHSLICKFLVIWSSWKCVVELYKDSVSGCYAAQDLLKKMFVLWCIIVEENLLIYRCWFKFSVSSFGTKEVSQQIFSLVFVSSFFHVTVVCITRWRCECHLATRRNHWTEGYPQCYGHCPH